MNPAIKLNRNAMQYRLLVFLPITLSTCVMLTVVLDMVESKFHGWSFYFSESFLFSSFWWIFLPLLFLQFNFASVRNKRITDILFVLIPIIAHLFAYPAIVWLISKLFYPHTFSFWQTFQYELTSYSFILLTAYSVPFIVYTFFKNKLKRKLDISIETDYSTQNIPITSLLVTDNNKRMIISTNDIFFFSANSPYINIHHKQKRYLHNETLKSVIERLDKELFVRVHKSVIVNIKKVQSYKSRLNGDYDLTMCDGTEIRLSRNYASSFKQKFGKTHRDTTE